MSYGFADSPLIAFAHLLCCFTNLVFPSLLYLFLRFHNQMMNAGFGKHWQPLPCLLTIVFIVFLFPFLITFLYPIFRTIAFWQERLRGSLFVGLGRGLGLLKGSCEGVGCVGGSR